MLLYILHVIKAGGLEMRGSILVPMQSSALFLLRPYPITAGYQNRTPHFQASSLDHMEYKSIIDWRRLFVQLP